jgi:catechol 2,3-dioxygenase-like lactoylglutathione lyase family enzyme
VLFPIILFSKLQHRSSTNRIKTYEKASPRICTRLDPGRHRNLLHEFPWLHGSKSRQPPLAVAQRVLDLQMQLNQVTVPSLDLSRSVAFYQLLGLRLIVDSVPRYARLECPDGGSTFSIHQVASVPTGHGVVVYFECADLDARVTELVALGLVFDSLPQDQTWLWREAQLRDPDGNALILYWAGEHRRFPPWRIAEEGGAER